MTIVSAAELPDFRPAPDQGGNIELHEAENQALDPDGRVTPWIRRTRWTSGGRGGERVKYLFRGDCPFLRLELSPSKSLPPDTGTMRPSWQMRSC